MIHINPIILLLIAARVVSNINPDTTLKNKSKGDYLKESLVKQHNTNWKREIRDIESNNDNEDVFRNHERTDDELSERITGKSFPENNYDAYKNYFFKTFSRKASFHLPLSKRIIKTRYGKLQGMVVEMKERGVLGHIEVFLGIPYATPPVGSKRFSPTKSLTPWDGVRISDHFQPVCPQKFPDISDKEFALTTMPKVKLEQLQKIQPFLRNQSEDCLYLNIFAPTPDGVKVADAQSEKRKTNYPVVVYIHGESFEWGSGNVYDGTVLSSNTKAIVVTFNYRLGILGFLNTNPEPRQKPRVANYGLMDQIAALHFIQQNIASFGGDPSNVTLIGHRSGAACITFLMTSPIVVPGLFHRAVLLSGSLFSPWALVRDPVNISRSLAKSLNCTAKEIYTEDHEVILECLRNISVDELLMFDPRSPNDTSTKFMTFFGPSVDGVVIKDDYANSYLTRNRHSGRSPSDNKKAGKLNEPFTIKSFSNTYDVMFGILSNELGSTFSETDVNYGTDVEERDKIIRAYVASTYMQHAREIFFTISNEYTDCFRIIEDPFQIRDSTMEALTDAQYVAPALQMADSIANFGGSTDDTVPRKSKLYFYVFNYAKDRVARDEGRSRANHGDELQYLFGAPIVGGFSHFENKYSHSEKVFTRKLLEYIGNFVRYGNPNSAVSPLETWKLNLNSSEKNIGLPKAKVQWEEYDPIHRKYMEIGQDFQMKSHYKAHKMSVWLRLIPELHHSGYDDTKHLYNNIPNKDTTNILSNILAVPFDRSLIEENDRNDSLHENKFLSQTNKSTYCLIFSNEENITNKEINHLDIVNDAAYSTALSLTIAIGCSLLIVNILIFVGVFHQKGRNEKHIGERINNHNIRRQSSLENMRTNPKNLVMLENSMTCEIEIVNEQRNFLNKRQFDTYSILPISQTK